MTVIADKVLVVFLDEALSAAGNSAAAAAESKAFSEVAGLGCNGFLVLPEIAQGKEELSDLESVLGVVHDGGNAQFKFPKMPVAFFSASSTSCALAKSLGFEIVHDITTPTAATDASASAKELLMGNAKQLVFLHLDVRVSEDHWVHALVLDLLQQQERDADSRCLVALVQSARQPHYPQQNAGSSSSPFWPRQSYEKVNGQYAAESSSSSTTNAELRRLLLSFYQKDRTRRDAVQRFDEAQIDALGSYGAMSALMFLKEVAFRLGFAPNSSYYQLQPKIIFSSLIVTDRLRIVSIDKGFESHSGITEIDKKRGPERSNWKKQQKSTTKKQEGAHSLARSQVSAYKAFFTLSAKHWTRGTSSSRRATAHEDDSDDDRATMYQAVSETEPMLAGARSPAGGKNVDAVGTGSVRSMRLEAPSPRCNDWIFAALFIVNVAVIGVFAFVKGLPVLKDNLKKNTSTAVNNEPQDLTHVFILSAGLVGGAVVLSLLWMKFLMAYAESMIRIALWLNVGLTVVFALTTFAVSPIMACLLLLMAGINVWYIYAVQDRIGFASANLKTACAAVSQHSVIFLVALLLLVKQTIWMVLWSLSAIGIYQMVKDSDPGCDEVDANGRPQRMCGGVGGGFTLFFMLISVYWGQQVLQNILTCTTAGVVASWWYQPNSKKVTASALYRSLTSSFGSICFGSLIVAVLQALRTMASILKDKAREDDNGALACVACLAECILNCLEGIMEYINQWAYVYVGIYGYDFKTSGKAVMDLFTNRGWTAVINDDLTSSALTFGALGVGVVTCVAGLLVAKFCPDKWFEALGSANTAYGVLGTIGFIAGMSMAMILANVVITALHTVFVCFAEDPIAFSRNHPREYEDLVNGWRKFHGDALVSAYGGAV